MKRIEALISPHQLDALKTALLDASICGFTVIEVLGFGTAGHAAAGRPVRKERDGAPRLKLEVVVHDDLVARVVDAIRGSSRSRPLKAGEIRVVPVAEALRIRTGEIDEAAIA